MHAPHACGEYPARMAKACWTRIHKDTSNVQDIEKQMAYSTQHKNASIVGT